MCYLVAKKLNSYGCIAYKTHHGSELDDLIKYINQETSSAIELAIISSPEKYDKYEPYTFVMNKGAFVASVTKLIKQVNMNVIDFKLVRFQMAAMCLRQHQEYRKDLSNAKIYNAWYQDSDNYLYVTYIVPVNENGEPKISKPTFRYFISKENGKIEHVSKVRTLSYDVINPDKIEY